MCAYNYVSDPSYTPQPSLCLGAISPQFVPPDTSRKLVMIVVSMWTACCVFPVAFFTDVSLTAPLPSFDGRAVQCPSVQNLRDYMSWRQVHCELAFHGERVGGNVEIVCKSY